MFSNIAIDLLKTLSKEELKKFDVFLNSPYFNTNAAVVRLFNAIKKHAPDFIDKSLTREKLFTKVYPGKDYSELSLRTRLSELTDLLRKFISIQYFEQDDFYKKFYFAREMNKREKYKIAEKFLLELLDENKKRNNVDPPVFFEKSELVNELMTTYRGDANRDTSERNMELGDALLNYFYSYFFQIANDMLYNEAIFKHKPEFNIIEEFINAFDFQNFLMRLKKHNYENQPIMEMYYRMYMSRIDKNNPEHFKILKELSFEHYRKFDKIGLFNLWVFLSNAINGSLQYIDSKYNYELFEVNKFFVGLKIFPLYPGSYFFQSFFDNIFTNMITCKEIDFAEKFLEEYLHLLQPEMRENSEMYCKAILELNKKNYDASLNYLSKVKLTDTVLKIRVRLYYFINYYETESFEACLSLMDSFKHFLKSNKKIPEYLIERVNSTLKYCSSIINARINNKKLDYAIYKEANGNKTGYWSREWIIKKMGELI
ncbi:MAG: hypothetical protein JST55_08880 [Bacteroidetes bacterium]|nr:hypothetical protein [Bacteroidota bacterium]